MDMGGLSGTKSDDFINAAKARGEAALQDKQPKFDQAGKSIPACGNPAAG